jgi:hypothetical protein
MGERAGERRSGRSTFLVGAGARERELGAVLSALARVRIEERGEKPPHASPETLADLEELLAPRPEEGFLILESGRIPGEDIGFVRRFLERHPAWRLLLIGEEAGDPRARGLLALPRAQWVPWPPDLDQLAALLGPATSVAASAGPAHPRGRRAGAERGVAALDVGELFEDLLAGAALEGEGAPRVQFRCEAPVVLAFERGVLADGLRGLFELARRCAGPDGLVRARVERPTRANGASASGARIALDFPLAELTEKDLPELLEQPWEGDARLADGVAAARKAAQLLREAGGRVALALERGRARCEIELEPAETPPEPRGRTRGAPGRAAKAEDPFA